jgi:hypothetical protein
MSDVKVLDLPQYQSNVVRQPHRFHTTSMGVREVLVDFLRWIALGLMAVLALIVIVGIGIPRRTPVTLRRRLHDVDPR